MVEKFITPQRNVIDFARYQQGLAVVKTLAFAKRLCRHCGAALADGENEDECSSAFNVGATMLCETPRKLRVE
jgi:hypothetical protein